MAGNIITRKPRVLALLLVVALHALVLWGLLRQRLPLTAADAVSVTVSVIVPPADVPAHKAQTPPPRPPVSRPPSPETPPPAIVAGAPSAISVPAAEASPAVVPAAAPSEPVRLGGELSAHCPARVAPEYPFISRRLGEEGSVLLQVELDAQGRVDAARIVTSSGHARLDEAALLAVRGWRCTPAQRNGQAVRSIAQQPFEFVLQRNRP